MATKPGVHVIVLANRLPGLRAAVLPAVRRAIAETMVEVETGAKERAPVDTGALRAGIHGQFTGQTSTVVGTSAQTPYARFVHDGTRHHSPRPFLSQAAEAVRPRWTDRIRAALRGLV